MLGIADNHVKDFKRRGMTGQNRDFAPAIESNRIAMCANDEDYGLKLRLDWKRADITYHHLRKEGWKMYFERTEIQNFKGVEKMKLEFSPGVNLLIGNNGVGKTTVLEALALSMQN